MPIKRLSQCCNFFMVGDVCRQCKKETGNHYYQDIAEYVCNFDLHVRGVIRIHKGDTVYVRGADLSDGGGSITFFGMGKNVGIIYEPSMKCEQFAVFFSLVR